MSSKLSPQEMLDNALGNLELYVRGESLEAKDPEGQVEMAAFDMGYQNVRLPAWIELLGKHFRVDVRKEWKMGRDSRTAS
jgi:hypothetical protein